MKASDFFTREKANEGVKVSIPAPDGSDSEHWLMVHSSDCDAFQNGRHSVIRSGIEVAKMPPEKREDELRMRQCRLAALLISDWSLEDEFSNESVADLMYNAPYIQGIVESAADNRRLFFGKESGS